MPQRFTKVLNNINSYWTSSDFYQFFMTLLQLLAASTIIVSINKKGDAREDQKYWILGYAIILMLSDIKLIWLKQDISSIENRVDHLDFEFADFRNVINKRSVETLRKLNELNQSIQMLNEELFESDQNNEKDEPDLENQEDDYFDDSFIENDDDEQDDEG